MIYGIGVDIVEIARVAELVAKSGDKFTSRILTPTELQVYHNKINKIAFLAKRFAAKEACAKALGTGIGEIVSFQDLEIIKEDLGRPAIKVSDKLAEFLRHKAISQLRLTLADEKHYAVAFVVAE